PQTSCFRRFCGVRCRLSKVLNNFPLEVAFPVRFFKFSHLLMQSSWQNRFLRCRVSLHAVIDNYSRRILGWCVEKLLNPLAALETLSAAGADNLSPAESSPDEAGARIVMDSGVENVNGI